MTDFTSSRILERAGSDEMRFLVDCIGCRRRPSLVATLTWFSEAHEPTWWPSVVAAAQREAVAPLLYAIVRDQALLPDTACTQLRESYNRTALRNALQMRELARVLDLLARADIKAVVLKGAALVGSVYDNIALRPMVDLDLLVHDTDVVRVQDLMFDSGYRRYATEPQAGSFLEYENEVVLVTDEPIGMMLDLHWRLLDSPYYQDKLDSDWFLQASVPARFEGVEGLVLGVEAQLLHLCAHLALHHGSSGLLRWYDVAEVIQRYSESLDWPLLLAKAEEFDLVLSVRHVLNNVSALWPVSVPEEILIGLSAIEPSATEVQVYGWLTTGEQPVVRRLWADLSGLPGWQRRFRFAWQNLFPTPAYMRQRYALQHDIMLPFAYCYRWWLGVRSALSSLRT